MDARTRHLEGFGLVCLNSAFFLQMSWIPMLGFLEGSDMFSLNTVISGHYFALWLMIAAPLAYGARLWLSERPEERGLALQEWAWSCLAPALSTAIGVKLGLRLAHASIPVILVLMAATVPLGIYGLVLKVRGTRAKLASSR